VFSRRLKKGYFALEGLNSFATVFFFYYFYFYMQKSFGFENKANLMLAALNGGTYALVVWFAGRFAQTRGYFTALKLGYATMIAALGMGLVVRSATGHVGVMVLTVVGMSFTWPTLEALVSEGEHREGLQHMVGVYNVVWAATAAVGSFSGGAMLEKLGLASLFYVPMSIHVVQLCLTLWLQSQANPPGPGNPRTAPVQANGNQASANNRWSDDSNQPAFPNRNLQQLQGVTIAGAALEQPALAERQELVEPTTLALSGTEVRPETQHSIPKARRFLRMAWLANPFAYIAINTLIAVVPGVARRLDLSTMAAGFCCSLWCFVRLGAFAALWQWRGWHYKFRWLLLAYLGLAASFGAIVLAPNVPTLLVGQVIFGGAVGLIYYSSLFYSMDRSETKGEHGGIHEAAIGLGNFAGPAVGAATLQLIPQYSQSGTIAVIVLLLCGLGGLVRIWYGTNKSV
jgi:predicted MFS family arabinose efflux permease